MMWIVLWTALAAGEEGGFDTLFSGKTMRFDYYHNGTAGEEHVSPREFRLEHEWAGSRVRLIDDTNLGKYLFELIDSATNRVVYSRGFCSPYGEWETTGEALRGSWRTFHESQRFPEPRAKAQVVIKKRAADGAFREIFSMVFEPESRFVNRSKPAPRGVLFTVLENGPPEFKVDLLLLAEGYTGEEAEKFRSDLSRLTGALFATEPFRSRKSAFNVRALHVPAAESGISNPRAGVWRASPLGASFNSFDSDRYVLTFADQELREVASQALYDALVIVCNTRKYGGGGIFNMWCTCAADSSEANYLLSHEFGHAFAGLGDEYYGSPVAYEEFTPAASEPWEPNVTALLDPAKLKWRDLVETGTPVPTPWNQERYDEVSRRYERERAAMLQRDAPEAEVEALFAKVKSATGPMLASEPYARKVGAFEGASYQAKGLYRPMTDCIMFTRNPEGFCPVCRRAIERVIDLYAQ
ncbi:MAG: M64 family metallopeptidase [Planctomycetota bacterium]